jgi:hypothetical protein
MLSGTGETAYLRRLAALARRMKRDIGFTAVEKV